MQSSQVPGAGNELNIPNYLRWATRQWPHSPAISDGVKTISYAELDHRADLLCQFLAGQGVEKGDRVGTLSSNRSEYGELIFGITRIGALAVPFNYRLSSRELAYQFDDCNPSIVFVEHEYLELAEAAAASADHAPTLIVIDPLDGSDYLSAVEIGFPVDKLPKVDASDPCFILYTSGTTGDPKGAVGTHQAFCHQAMARIIAQSIPVGTSSVWLSALQLFHLGALVSLIPSVMTGGHFITVSQAVKEPRQILGLIEKFKVETCSLIPAQWEGLLAVPGIELADLHIKRVSIGTQASSVDLFQRIGRLVPGVSLFNSFGQTETAGITCSLSGEEAVLHPGSVGRPVLGTDLRIVDEKMNDVADGHAGEIVYQGPGVCQEYWNNPEGTADAWHGGWFHSGDIAQQDEHGRIWILDRKKDMIISGGENIYPAEIEQVLVQHPDVAEVAVVGVSDPRWGETPCALIVPKDINTPPEVVTLVDFVVDNLASYKKPRYYFFINSLPRNATGKIQKMSLRKKAVQLAAEQTEGAAAGRPN